MRRLRARFAGEPQLLLPMFAAANGIGYLPLLTLPWLMGSLVRDHGYSDGVAGLLATLELACIATTTILVGLLLRRMNRRVLVVAGGCLASLSSAALPTATSLPGIGALLALTGIGCGLCSAAGNSLLGAAKDPARMTANLWIWTVAWQTLVWFVTPLAVERWQAVGLSAVLVASCILLMPALLRTPLLNPPPLPISSLQSRENHLGVGLILLLLACTLAFWLRDSAIWSLAERRGLQLGLTQHQLALTFVGASILGLGGPVVANYLGLRWGRSKTVLTGLLAIGFVMQAIASTASPRTYQLGFLLWTGTSLFAWTYLMEVAAGLDASGRVAALCGSTMFMAGACGPLLGGLLMGWETGSALAGIVLLLTGTTILPLLPVLRFVQRRGAS